MNTSIIIILFLYYLIGALGVVLINRKKPHEKKERWIKYFYYLVITSSVLVLMHFELFNFGAAFIGLIGLKEILDAYGSSKRKRITPFAITLLMYILLGFFFYRFSYFISDIQIFVYTLVIAFDGFCQISGQLFGKRKLASKISPAKTIEGFAGGLIMTVFTAFLLPNTFLQPAWLFALLIAFSSLIGDLGASWFKRECEIKDYSNLIPGHGGILDRFDSLIATGATVYVVLYVMSF